MSNKDRLCQHYRSIGIDPVNSARFASLVDKWINNSGPEWTVQRLKSLEVAFKAKLANADQPVVIPQGWATRTTRKGRTVFADGLVQRMMDTTSRKGLKVALSFFRSAQIVVLDRATDQQVEKFKEGISRPQPSSAANVINYCRPVFDYLNKGALRFLKKEPTHEETMFLPLAQWPKKKGKSSPVYDPEGGKEIFPSISRADMRVKSIENLIEDSDWAALWKRYPEEFSTCLVGDSTYLPQIEVDHSIRADIPNGKITLIPEPAAKLRAVANPCLSIQALGEPLKRRLYSLCLRIGAIYTHDQRSAQDVIANWLADGSKVWCFDASAFTDRFPVQLQVALLESLRDNTQWVTQFDIDVLNTVIGKGWRMPDRDKTLVKYEVGQPMGFGPSFHLACLSHYYLVMALAMDSSLQMSFQEVNKSVTIVGDDIVIRHEGLASLYRSAMEQLGVEINMTKSVISDRYAEFCGKMIDELGPIESIKTRHIKSQDQLIRTLEFYGSKGFDHLEPHEQVWALKAVLPDFLGGIGFKPDGMSYKEYLKALNVDKISYSLLLDDLSQHLSVVANQDVKATLDTLSQSFDVIAGEFSDVLKSHLHHNAKGVDDKPPFSDWTGLPVQPGSSDVSVVKKDMPSHLLTRRPWSTIVDEAVRSDLTHAKHSIKSAAELRSAIPDLDRYIDPNHGYLNLDSDNRKEVLPSEGIPTHTLILKEESACEQNSSKPETPRSDHLRYTNFGENGGSVNNKRQAEAVVRGYSKEKVKDFIKRKAKERSNRSTGEEPEI